MLFLFDFNLLLAELTRMLWVIILHEYKSLNPLAELMMGSHNAAVVGLIQFALQIFDFATGKISRTIPEPFLCLTVV